jgi:multisubunit Na+/H+ antiporter MnhB subunit
MSPVAAPDEVYRAVTRLFAVIILGFGLAILVVTLVNGGGPLSTGFLLGVVFVALGSGRLYLAMRGRR